MSNEQTPFAFFHSPCLDGICAFLIQQKETPNIEACPVSHFAPLPKVLTEGRIGYYVDYTPSVEFLRNSLAKESIVYDHHHDGIKKLTDALKDDPTLISEKSVLDTNKSACGILWDVYHPNEPLPDLFKYVQDRDLFKMEYPESRYLGYTLPAGTLENRAIFEKLRDEPSELEKYIFAGKLISEKIESMVKGLSKAVRVGKLTVEDVSHSVGIIQLDGSTGIINEMGRYVADTGIADICVMWSPCEVGYNYSIRAKYGLDCPQISHAIKNKSPNAAKFRSGGSKDAAGATSDLAPEEIFEF